MGETRRHVLLLVALLLPGCASGPGSGGSPPPRAAHCAWEAGRSVEGRSIACHEIGEGKESVLFLATIHGNEAAGTPLLRRLAVELIRRPGLLAGRRVLIVPVANPDGMARGTRRNARGVDLNRNLPAASFRVGGAGGPGPLSEPESRALHSLILLHSPARVVSIHQPLGLVDFDGPAGDLARSMASAAGMPVRRLGGRPGSLGSWAGVSLGIPTVTVELPRAADRMTDEELFEVYGPMLLAAISGPASSGGGGGDARP